MNIFLVRDVDQDYGDFEDYLARAEWAGVSFDSLSAAQEAVQKYIQKQDKEFDGEENNLPGTTMTRLEWWAGTRTEEHAYNIQQWEFEDEDRLTKWVIVEQRVRTAGEDYPG